MSMEGLKLGMTIFFSYLPEAKKRCRMLHQPQIEGEGRVSVKKERLGAGKRVEALTRFGWWPR